MHLNQIAAELRAHFETAKTDVEKFLEVHVPQLADLADRAAANPLVDAALGVVHVSPEMLTSMADVLRKFDADLAALQPAHAAAEQAPADAQAS